MNKKDFKIDHDNPKKVLVWNDKDCIRMERYPLILKNYCIAVEDSYEKDYLNKRKFDTCYWNYWELIPEKKKRLITAQELLERGARFYRDKNTKNKVYMITAFDIKDNFIYVFDGGWCEIENMIKNCELHSLGGKKWSSDGKEWHSFEVEE